MKDLWRWLKIEMQYMNVSWNRLIGYLILITMWLCVGVSIYSDDMASALLFTVMVIAWKMSWSRDA